MRFEDKFAIILVKV